MTATIPVTAATVSEVVEGANLLKTPQGQVKAIESAVSIFVLDFPDRSAREHAEWVAAKLLLQRENP